MQSDRRLHISKIGRLLSSSSQVIPSSSQLDDLGTLSQEQKQQGFEEDDTGFIFKRASQEDIGKVSQPEDNNALQVTKQRRKRRSNKASEHPNNASLFLKGKQITQGLEELLNRSLSQQAKNQMESIGNDSSFSKMKVKRKKVRHRKVKKAKTEVLHTASKRKNKASIPKEEKHSLPSPKTKRRKMKSQSVDTGRPEGTLLDVLEYDENPNHESDNTNLLVSSGEDTDQVFSLDDDVDDSVIQEETYTKKPQILGDKIRDNSLELHHIDQKKYEEDAGIPHDDSTAFYQDDVDMFDVDEQIEQDRKSLVHEHVTDVTNLGINKYLATTDDPIVDIASKIPLKESIESTSQDQDKNNNTSKYSRRSSLSNRGKRLSSIGNGLVAEPHSKVPIEQFYKHFDKDLPDPHKMRQLLVWCCRRIDFGASSEKDKISARLAENIKQRLINDLVNGKIDINLWQSEHGQTSSSHEISDSNGADLASNTQNLDSQLNLTEKTKQPIIVKPNDANIRNIKLLREYKSKLERLKKEEDAWKKAVSTSAFLMDDRSSEKSVDFNEPVDSNIGQALGNMRDISRKISQRGYSITFTDMVERIKSNVHKLKKSDDAIALVIEAKMKELTRVLKESTDLTNDGNFDPKLLLQALARSNLSS